MGCSCPPSGPYYCDPCAHLAARAGLEVPILGMEQHRRQPLSIGPDAPEHVFQDKLHSLALDLGYLYSHPYRSKQSTPGWLDTALCHPDGSTLFLWELKAEDGHISGTQQRWLAALSRVTQVHTAVYRPRDWETMKVLLTRR